VEKGYQPDERNRFSRSYAASLPLEHCKPKFLEEKAIGFLEAHRDEPFILYINFLEPHMPFFGPLDSLYSPDEVILPGSFNDVASNDDPLSHRLKWEGNKRQYGNTEKEFRELIARYWGLVTQVDISVGAILDKLESLGLSENTIVVYTSDHGDMMGAHRMVAKGVMYEEAVRIPFLLKDLRMNTSQRVIRERVSQVDIVPTLLDLMGHEVPGYLEGKSLVPALKGKEFPSEDIFIEWNSDMDYRVRNWADRDVTEADSLQWAGNPSIRTVISKEGWKLSLSNRDKSQLFDLNADPLEINNLFYKEEYEHIIKDLAGKIRNWQNVTHDTLFFPVN
jgi:arylsulfatase A-like enzyme